MLSKESMADLLEQEKEIHDSQKDDKKEKVL
jgi:hypothetical protein